ncbi:MAG TPA: sulfite exporter TauE/SafE family protein [Stellaceae bacterium]|jgi:hypothetical protein|nr:sulfite exporter TauE/SafE family protein [Stellaceae bacterium]
MDIYLPIVGMSQSVIVLLLLGGAVGFLSGIFGVGGGWLMTPLLIFIGIPPIFAVAASANQLVGSSVAGTLAQWRRGNIDFTMGLVMLAGGLVGSALGVWLFAVLRRIGQIEIAINFAYILMLGSLGIFMLFESVRAILFRQPAVRRKLHQHSWVHGLPLKMRFRRSKLYISAIAPAAVGFAGGFLSGVLGVGGGFLMVPAMIYLLDMPTALVPGTSLFQIIFVAASVTILQSVENGTVDIVLALILLVGGVIGVRFGTRVGARLKGEYFRVLLGMLVLAAAVKLAADLTITPRDLYSLDLRAP